MKQKNPQFVDIQNDHLKLHEMQGYHGLKMKKEALRLSRYFLEKPWLDGDQFCESVDVVGDFAGRSTKWLSLIEKAYRQVKRSDKENARRKMLMFYSQRQNREAVLRYLPKRITPQTDLFELLVTWEIWLENDRMDKLEKTVPIMSKAIQTAASSRMRAWLSSLYARYWSIRADLLGDEELECYLKNMKQKLGNDAR